MAWRSGSEEVEEVRSLLAEALPGCRDPARKPRNGSRADLLAAWRGSLLEVEIESVRAPRIAEVEGLLARFALRVGQQKKEKRVVPVLVVAFRRFGSRLEQAIRKFMASYAPTVGWGLLDESDRAVLAIPSLGVDWQRGASDSPPVATLFQRRDRGLFTDLNRWMLKVLLLREAPAGLWGGPRALPRHPTELARIARVSVSKAHHFVATFEQEGYLRRSRQGLRLVRLAELLEAWLQDEKNGSPVMVPARSLLPARASRFADDPRPEEPPLPEEAGSEAVLGGAFAALHAGLLRIGGRLVPLVHVRPPLSRAVSAWHLEPCELRDARMVLANPLFPRSVFRGVIHRPKGLPIVDLWQIALDSVSSAARGREQAEYVAERVLALQEEA